MVVDSDVMVFHGVLDLLHYTAGVDHGVHLAYSSLVMVTDDVCPFLCVCVYL
jgi:hypothetical protein